MTQTKIFPTIVKAWKIGKFEKIFIFTALYIPLLVTHFECKLLNMLKLVDMFAEARVPNLCCIF